MNKNQLMTDFLLSQYNEQISNATHDPTNDSSHKPAAVSWASSWANRFVLS